MESAMHQVEVIAHRGASAYAPENTYAAFDLALEMGSDAIETDVRCTRDGSVVLCHDATVDRVSNGTGDVAALTLEDLQDLDFGARFAPRFSGQRVVPVGEFLLRYGHRCPLVLEIKAQAACEPLVDTVVASHLVAGVIFTSFELARLETVHDVLPQAHIGYLTRTFDSETIQRVRRLGFAQICPRARDLTIPLVGEAHAAGLVVRAWGVGSPDDQEHALQMGGDGMTTNWPDRLIARLVQLGWR